MLAEDRPVICYEINSLRENSCFIEAAHFDDYGGWVLDTQYIQNIGSSYLLAHGLGNPVKNAVARINLPKAGSYRLWVYTKDWVAAWKKDIAPGVFKILVNGAVSEVIFGNEGLNWHWQDGGIITVPDREAIIEVADLTGYEGRFAGIYLTADLSFKPPAEKKELTAFRRAVCGFDTAADLGSFDFVVAGAGIAGMACAVTASRLGLKTALVHDRYIIGGNNSSEVRVWLTGKTCFDMYPLLGKVTNEFDQKINNISGAANKAENYEDDRKLSILKKEKNLTLFLGYALTGCTTTNRSSTDNISTGTAGIAAGQPANIKITEVEIYNVKTCSYGRLSAPFFADCTGDGTLGYLAGADYEVTAHGHMELSNFWSIERTETKQEFKPCPWAIDLIDCNFIGRLRFRGKVQNELANTERWLGNWQWGSGFELPPVENDEKARDINFRAMYGAWDAVKNHDDDLENYKIGYCSYIAGKRESRRLLGDHILTAADLIKSITYDDAIIGLDCPLDLHRPHTAYYPAYHEGNAIHALSCGDKFKAPYYMPYRCLYSRNVVNMFMAGRNISVTHDALGSVRIQRTCGLMGEAAGTAAYLCNRYGAMPRDIYRKYIDELKRLFKD